MDGGCLSLQADDEYMLSDDDVFVNRFISVPKDMGQLNCAAFVAGILKGALHGSGFPARWPFLSLLFIMIPALYNDDCRNSCICTPLQSLLISREEPTLMFPRLHWSPVAMYCVGC